MHQDSVMIGSGLPWFPDETLYSWCSRYHRLAVNGLASVTCRQLFGQRRLGVAHDFPAGIAAFVERTQGSLGSVEEIIDRRTLLPFYLPFRSQELAADARRRMASEGIGSLKYQLGLLTSGLGAAHPLKACPSCMSADRRQFAVAYWHRTHQLPAIWYCPQHGEPLQVSPLKLDQRARFQWALPADSALVDCLLQPDDDDTNERLQMLHRVADFGVALISERPGRLADLVRLAGAFRFALVRLGWVGGTGRIAWKRFHAELLSHTNAFSILPPLAMQLDVATAKSQLCRIVAARSLTHPLRYLVWMAWLFEDWRDMLEAYDGATSGAWPASSTDGSEVRRPQEDPRAAAAAAEVLSGKMSTTAVARCLGVSVSTVAAWTAKAGKMTPRRPKVLTQPLWLAAVDLLLDGRDKPFVAERCGISVVSVTRILRSVPGLQSRWHEVRRDAMRVAAREAWATVAEASGLLGISATRRLQPRAYAWLYRNDRDWLAAQRARINELPRLGNHARVRMQRADTRYARGLSRALAASPGNGIFDPSKRETWTIAAPGLVKVMKAPQSWPLTVAVLRSALTATHNAPSESLF